MMSPRQNAQYFSNTRIITMRTALSTIILQTGAKSATPYIVHQEFTALSIVEGRFGGLVRHPASLVVVVPFLLLSGARAKCFNFSADLISHRPKLASKKISC